MAKGETKSGSYDGGGGNGWVAMPEHVANRLALLKQGVSPVAPGAEFQPPAYLRIQGHNRPLDPLAIDAMRQVEVNASCHDLQAIANAWEQQRFATPLAAVSRSLNRRGLAFDERLLLSQPAIYVRLILDLEPNLAALEDTLGFSEALLRRLRNPSNGLLASFYQELSGATAERLGIPVGNERRDQVAHLLMERKPDLGPNRIVPAFEEIYEELVAQGEMPRLVALYLKATGLDNTRITPPALRRRMVSNLIESGVRIDPTDEKEREKFAWGEYDELFAVALQKARSQGTQLESVAPASGGWDFSVDIFDHAQDIAIEQDNILAAGFMDYAYEVGERLHVFDLMDALYIEWTRGGLDLPQSEAATKLEKLWRDREARDSSEERALGYMKALGKGSATTMDRSVVNRDFPRLWGALMEEVARFIQKRETAANFGDTSPVSRAPIFQATKQLQYNLTQHGNGRTKSQATQLRSLLKTCFEVLDAPQIADAYATPNRRDRWTIIERLHHRLPEFGRAPNVSAIRTAAAEGNRVFQWIASFSEGSVKDDEFNSFLRAAESWIIAKSGDQEEEQPASDEAFEGDFGEDEFADEFDDFDV